VANFNLDSQIECEQEVLDIGVSMGSSINH